MFRSPLFFVLPVLLLAGCFDPASNVSSPQDGAVNVNYTPTVSQQFECLPTGAAFIAAHRGTSKGRGLAENSESALGALIDEGLLFAEIDVSRLRDGTHILFHDGGWDKESTGRGPVSKSTMSKASSYLLKDDRGRVTSESPVAFTRVLEMAKDKIYLEVDFKSSSNEADVIKMIEQAGMSDQVILIAYSQKQAARLARLSRDMMLSVPVRHIGDIKAYQVKGVSKSRIAAWLSGASASGDLARELRERGIPVLAKHKRDQAVGSASLLVTDWAFKVPRHRYYKGISGMTKARAQSYQKCLDEI